MTELFAPQWLNNSLYDDTFVQRILNEQNATPAYATLARNAALLTLHSDWATFEPLAATFSATLPITKGDLPTSAEDYDRLRYDNDVLVAQCYGLNSQDLRHILAGFPVMQNKRAEYTTFFNRDF